MLVWGILETIKLKDDYRRREFLRADQAYEILLVSI